MKQLGLRLAEKKDCRLLWKWRNEESVRKFAFKTRFIPYEEHKKWFDEKLKNPNTQILILLNGGKEVGQIRFDVDAKRVAEIDISIDKDERGKGYGTKGLQIVCKYGFKNFKIEKIISHIKKNNEVSLTTFIKVGFISNGLRKFKSYQCYEMSLYKGKT